MKWHMVTEVKKLGKYIITRWDGPSHLEARAYKDGQLIKTLEIPFLATSRKTSAAWVKTKQDMITWLNKLENE